jgi:acyl carrier protein
MEVLGMQQVGSSGVRDAVFEAVASAAELPIADVEYDTDLDDLGLDSFSYAGILVDVEDALGMEVPIELLDNLVEPGRSYTVREFVDLFVLLVSRTSAVS